MNELFKKAIEKFETNFSNCEIIKMKMLENSHYNGKMINARILIEYCENDEFKVDCIISMNKVEICVSIDD